MSVNTQALSDPAFITAAAREFGSQCVVVSIDVKAVGGTPRVFSAGGAVATSFAPEAWAREAKRRGAGEILLNSIDRDGSRLGYDIPLIERVAAAVDIPVIALGGAGEWEHCAEVLLKTRADAVAAANIFHYSDQSVYAAKRFLFERGLPVRPPDLLPV